MDQRLLAAATLAGALLLVGGLLLVPPVGDAVGFVLQGDLGRLREQAAQPTVATAALLVALVLIHVVVPFPAELPTAAAGFAFGFLVGFPLMVAAWAASALGAYWLAAAAGRPALTRLAGRERLARAELLVARGGVTALLAARLIPIVPFSLTCYACGILRVPLWRFLWTTVVGFMPLTALVVLFGARLQEPSLADPVLWVTLGGALALVLAARPLARRANLRTGA